MADTQRPSVGRVVHYVARGSADGKYPKTCRAALVTEVIDNPSTVGESLCIGLAAINPTGLFFHSVAEGGCEYDDADKPAGGTWHWPERV